jgi:hypothetical protein
MMMEWSGKGFRSRKHIVGPSNSSSSSGTRGVGSGGNGDWRRKGWDRWHLQDERRVGLVFCPTVTSESAWRISLRWWGSRSEGWRRGWGRLLRLLRRWDMFGSRSRRGRGFRSLDPSIRRCWWGSKYACFTGGNIDWGRWATERGLRSGGVRGGRRYQHGRCNRLCSP